MTKPFIKRFDVDSEIASVFLFAFANEYAGVNNVNMAMFNHFMFISRSERIGTVFNIAYCDEYREFFVSKKSLYYPPDVVKRALLPLLPNKNIKGNK